MIKDRSLGKKILYAMIVLVVGLLLVAGTIYALSLRKVSSTLAASNHTLSETIGGQSSAYMTEQSKNRMLELAGEKAEIADEFFREFERGVMAAASVAGQIYDNPELYSPRSVPLPDPEKDGELTMQVLYSAQTDPADPKIAEELALIGNVQDVLMAVNASQENMVSLYVATESGFMVQADYIPAKNSMTPVISCPWRQKSAPGIRGRRRPESRISHRSPRTRTRRVWPSCAGCPCFPAAS